MPDDSQVKKPPLGKCDGQCTPDLALYYARCPLHGAALWGLVLDIEASNADERAAAGAADGE